MLVYTGYGAPLHFFLHALTGWNVGLLLLLSATYFGRAWAWWDGLLALALALYALTPDFIYAAGPFHHDWMDIFLFHPSLDEIIPLAVPVLAGLWAALLVTYIRYRAMR